MAATLDAVSSGTVNNTTSVTIGHTVAADATVLVVIVPYWSSSPTVGQLTGITWNGVAMTKIGDSTRSNANDIVEVYFQAGPATGTHNVVATFQSANQAGFIHNASWKGTSTSGGSGTVWADLTTTKTASAAANSSVSVPNNTANDVIMDAVSIGNGASPTMGVQTNRVQLGSENHAGEGTGASRLNAAPNGSQTMNWTFTSTTSAQAAIRILAAATGLPPGLGPEAGMDLTTMTAHVAMQR